MAFPSNVSLAPKKKVSFSPDEIVDFLRQHGQLGDIYDELLRHQIIVRNCEEKGIEVFAEELQAKAEQVRREEKLEKATDTFDWLTDQKMSPEDWEVGLKTEVLSEKLAKTLFEKEVEKEFAEGRLDFDQIVLYCISFQEASVAQEVVYQLEEKEITFQEAAWLYDTDPQRRLKRGFEGTLYRWQLATSLTTELFGAPFGSIVGPLNRENGYHVYKVESFTPAQLNDELREKILDNLFSEWLEDEVQYLLYGEAAFEDDYDDDDDD